MGVGVSVGVVEAIYNNNLPIDVEIDDMLTPNREGWLLNRVFND